MAIKLLLTGFEPFGLSPDINVSAEVIKHLAAAPVEGATVVTAILPVDRSKTGMRILQLLDETQPDAILCLGEAGSYAALSIERVAINLLDWKQPDNGGYVATDELIRKGGPGAYFSTLPVRSIHQRLRDAGIPCKLSLSAGSYICNLAMYVVLDALAERAPATPAGLIHVPFLPEQAAKYDWPSMSLETTCRAVAIALQTLGEAVANRAGPGTPIKSSAGAPDRVT